MSFIQRFYTLKYVNVIILFGIVLRVVAIVFTPEIADAKNAHQIGEIFLKTGEIYKTDVLYPYPPLIIIYVGFASYVSTALHIPFVYLLKLPPFIADISILLILNKILKDRRLLIFYSLNPILITVSSVFGKEDPVVILLAFLAYLQIRKKKSYLMSSLLLGFSIWIKTFTILLLPVFVSQVKGIKNKISYVLLCLVPFGLMLLPFLVSDFSNINRNYFSYTGSADYGWLAILKTASGILAGTSINFTPLNASLGTFLNLSKYLYLIIYGILLIYNRKNTSVLHNIIWIFLLFYIIYGGIGTNYMYWILPFLFLTEQRSIIIHYTLFGFTALSAYILVQFYSPILQYYKSIWFLKSPLYLNIFYIITLSFFWIFLIRTYVNTQNLWRRAVDKPINLH